MITVLSVGAILAWIRLETGSIWPCIMVHAAWNALINAGFTFAMQNAAENIWIGEAGILVVTTLILARCFSGAPGNPPLLSLIECHLLGRLILRRRALIKIQDLTCLTFERQSSIQWLNLRTHL
jgi:hypothetical protein